MTLKFGVKIENGKLIILDPRWHEWLKTAKNGIYSMTVKRPKNQRTSDQNAYYWGVVIKIAAEYFGYYPEEMHEAFKWLFARKSGIDGLPDTVKSTSKMGTTEFFDYVEMARMWLRTEHGIDTPDPNEVEL